MQPRIKLLGGYGLSDAAGGALRLPTRKSWALLGYLALSGGREIQRESIAALLWPRSNDGQARASLRQELAVLRKIMARAALPEIDSSKDMLCLDMPDGLVDALAIEHLVGQGTAAALREAVGYYTGELLNGLNIAAHPFEDWLWVERQRLRALAQSAYLQLLDLDAAGDDPQIAIATAKALLKIEPTQELGHRALMRLYRRTGRRTEALQQFERCAETLRRELDADPSQETAQLAARIRADITGVHGSGDPKRPAHVSRAVPGQWLGPTPARPEVHKVTILVARQGGIAALGTRCNPSDLARAQDRFADRCARIISAHGGAVVFGTGDRVIGCFGYPVSASAGQDQPIRAALAIVSEPEALSPETELWPSAGIAIGPVLIRAAPRDPDHIDLTGVPLHLAAAYAWAAQDKEVVVGRDVHDRIGPDLDAMPLDAERYGATRPQDPGVVIHTFRT